MKTPRRAQIKRISWGLTSFETNKSNKPQFYENRRAQKILPNSNI